MNAKTLLLFAMLLFAVMVTAQEGNYTLQQIHNLRISTQQTGMMTLGGWAAGNMLVSGIGMSSTKGSTYRFHQMNVFWNVVNMGIAAGGYFSALPAGDALPLKETLSEYHRFNNLLLFNAGLDIAYVMAGFYLKEKARNSPKRRDLFKGYGNSVIMQGAFLFLFDVVLYYVNQSQISDIMDSKQLQFMMTPGGVGVVLTF